MQSSYIERSATTSIPKEPKKENEERTKEKNEGLNNHVDDAGDDDAGEDDAGEVESPR